MHVIARLRITLRKAARPGLGQVPVASLAIVGALAASAGAAPVPGHRASPPDRQPTCFQIGSTQRRQLEGVAAPSAASAWAVGSTESGRTSRTLAEHWNGTAWTQVASPSGPGGGILFGIAAPSVRNAWAVGLSFPGAGSQTLAEHWNGTAWAQTPSQNPAGASGGSFLSGVAASSSTSAWAAGYYSLGITPGSATRTLMERWTGSGWTRVASPNPDASGINVLRGITALSATDAWAVGNYDHHTTGQPLGRPLIEHWNGTAWTVTAGPQLAAGVNTGLTGVAAVSPADAWAVGSYCAGAQGLRTLTEHWNGTAWTHVASPNPSQADATWLSGVAATSASNAWATGFYFNHHTGYHPVIEHWNGKAWTIVHSP